MAEPSSSMSPAPIAAQAPSPPPTTTGVPASSPQASAASASSPPATLADGSTSGSLARSMSPAASSSADQACARWSQAFVPEASEGSMQRRPVSRRVRKSLATRTPVARAQASGSWRRSHIHLGRQYVGSRRCPRRS